MIVQLQDFNLTVDLLFYCHTGYDDNDYKFGKSQRYFKLIITNCEINKTSLQ